MGETVKSSNGKYEWDCEKNLINIQKHGISFEEACEVFNDSYSIEILDEEHSTLEETRYICYGNIGDFIIAMVVYTDRSGIIRIISARPAVQKEKEVYNANLKRAFGTN